MILLLIKAELQDAVNLDLPVKPPFGNQLREST